MSNATVESWFKTVKIDRYIGSKCGQKCGRFIRLMRDRVETVCKQVILNIRKKRLTRPVCESNGKLCKIIHPTRVDKSIDDINMDAVDCKRMG